MSQLRLRRAELADADALAPRLREEDLQEILAADGRSPVIVLREGIASSDPCWAVSNTGDLLVALFGVIPDSRDSRQGKIWLLGAPALLEQPLSVSRLSRCWVEELQQRYPVLWNYVDSRNTVHVRWLERCGFKIIRRIEEFGVERRPFLEVERSGSGKAWGKIAQPSM